MYNGQAFMEEQRKEMSFLHVDGKEIRNQEGRKVFLRGVSLGGWLNMENFITGHLGSESIARSTVREELGEERAAAFFDTLLDCFVTEEDFKFLAHLGATMVRIPFNYRHFEDDMNPGVYREGGFTYLDRAVEWAKKHGLYVVLDLHAAQGWQNEGWHSDNAANITLLWTNRDYRNRVKRLWASIAERYKDEDHIAGYDLLNEPEAPTIEVLNEVHHEIVTAIRAVDTAHIIFLEGNNYSRDFAGFEEPFDDNLVYSSHQYIPSTAAGRRYPGMTGSTYIDRAWIEKELLARTTWIVERNRPSWIGEFGALYDGPTGSPTGADLARLEALKDQLELFGEHEQHWTLWTYKDVGVQGLVVPKRGAAYLERIKPISEIKMELGLDSWTAREQGLLRVEAASIMRVVGDRIASRFHDYSLDFGSKGYRRIGRNGICSAISNLLAPLYADRFREMTADEIRKMVREAFELRNCERREYLIDLLKQALRPKG